MSVSTIISVEDSDTDFALYAMPCRPRGSTIPSSGAKTAEQRQDACYLSKLLLPNGHRS